MDPVAQQARYQELKPKLDAVLEELKDFKGSKTRAQWLETLKKELNRQLSELKFPKEGEFVVCFYEKHGTFWVGPWNRNISCTRWRRGP